MRASKLMCLGLTVLCFAACGSEDEPAPPDGVELDGVIYGLSSSEAYATDEAAICGANSPNCPYPPSPIPPPQPPYCEGTLYGAYPKWLCLCSGSFFSVSPDGHCPPTTTQPICKISRTGQVCVVQPPPPPPQPTCIYTMGGCR